MIQLILVFSFFAVVGCTPVENSETVPETHVFLYENGDKGWSDIFNSSQTHGIDLGAIFQGPVPYSENETQNFVPASTTKLFTASLALQELGPDYRFETRLEWFTDPSTPAVAYVASLVGGGDPSLGALPFDLHSRDRLTLLAQQMRSKGIKFIKGPLIVVSRDPRWDKSVEVPGVNPTDYEECYGSVSHNFNFRKNCIVYEVTGPNSGHWEDPDLAFPVTVTLSEGEQTNIDLVLHYDSHQNIIRYGMTGTWKKGRTLAYPMLLPVPEINSWLRNALSRELKKQGIVFVSDDLKSRGPKNMVSVVSPPLSEILIEMNKHSDNFLADAFFKTLGEHFGDSSKPLEEASRDHLNSEIQKWAQGEGVPELGDELQFWEGAGLSHQNRATPRAFLFLLHRLASRPDFHFIWDSLPIAGIDGTLKYRMRGTEAQGWLRGKTGTVSGAYQLAGYVPQLSAEQQISAYIPFVILTSTSPHLKNKVRRLEDEAAERLMKYVNPGIGHKP